MCRTAMLILAFTLVPYAGISGCAPMLLMSLEMELAMEDMAAGVAALFGSKRPELRPVEREGEERAAGERREAEDELPPELLAATLLAAAAERERAREEEKPEGP